MVTDVLAEVLNDYLGALADVDRVQAQELREGDRGAALRKLRVVVGLVHDAEVGVVVDVVLQYIEDEAPSIAWRML